MKKVLVLAVALMATILSARAEVEFAYEAGAEIVSSYIWRGQYNGGLSFQPEALVGLNALDGELEFRGGIWANIGASDWMFKKDQGDGTGYTKFMPELDVILSVSAYGASVGFNHYYYCDGSNFFSWDGVNGNIANGNTSTTEFWFGYNFGHYFGEYAGAYINWYTTIAGNDYNAPTLTDLSNGLLGHKAYSTYIELGYDYTFEDLGLTLGAQMGISPWESTLYGNTGFNVVNLQLKANKEWEFDAFTLDVFAQGNLNPDGINKYNAFINGAGDDKLYLQKLNGVIGVGIWF